MIKSRRIEWTGHAARTGEMTNAYKIMVGKPQGRNGSEYIDDINRGRVWTGFPAGNQTTVVQPLVYTF
jgi:hypothetical protein